MTTAVKALTLKGPWDRLIVDGHKDIENRNQRWYYTGPVLIHAGKSLDDLAIYETREGYKLFTDFKELLEANLPKEALENYTAEKIMRMPRGGIIGIATITNCLQSFHAPSSPWFFGRFGYTLSNARSLPFIPCRGQLGFWDVPQEVLDQLPADVLAELQGVRS